MTKLRGLAWDHRRCWGPLEASVAPAWQASHPSVEITGTGAACYDFGEAPLDAVLGNYDLVIFDHPFVGEIAEGALMVPFDDHLSAEEKAFFEQDSVGKSWQSYQRDGRQWALPIDAACQVASYRPDLLAGIGAVPREPSTRCWRSAARRAQDGKWIGLPLVPTDAMCLILTFTNPTADGEGFVERAAVERAVGELRELAELAHPLSTRWNPIRCYDHMIAEDDVVYVPFAFGYVNYASRTDGRRLALRRRSDARMRSAPCSAAPASGSAHSRRTARRRSTMRAICARPQVQRTDYVEAGGQPGSLSGLARRGRQRGDRRLLRRHAEDHPGLLSQADASRASWPSFAIARRAPRRRSPARFPPTNSFPSSIVATGSRSAAQRLAAETSPDGRRRRTAGERGAGARRISRAGSREGARHPRVHGRSGERADADRDLGRSSAARSTKSTGSCTFWSAAAISCAPGPTATGCR